MTLASSPSLLYLSFRSSVVIQYFIQLNCLVELEFIQQICPPLPQVQWSHTGNWTVRWCGIPLSPPLQKETLTSVYLRATHNACTVLRRYVPSIGKVILYDLLLFCYQQALNDLGHIHTNTFEMVLKHFILKCRFKIKLRFQHHFRINFCPYMPENSYHITIHVQWACWCKQEPDCPLTAQSTTKLSWFLSCRKCYSERTAISFQTEVPGVLWTLGVNVGKVMRFKMKMPQYGCGLSDTPMIYNNCMAATQFRETFFQRLQSLSAFNLNFDKSSDFRL